MLKNKWIYTLLATLSMPVFAAQPDKNKLETQFAKLMGKQTTIDEINPTPVPDIYEVVIGPEVLYTTADGNYVFYGHLIDIKGEQPKSLTEVKSNQLRAKLIKNVDEKTMLVFKPTGETKHTVTVFTDIDCAYCRQLHQEIPLLNQKGIAVRYVAFPRTGVDSPSFKKLVAVWCADNPQEAFTEATKDKEIPLKPNCNKADIIKQHLQLVDNLGLRVTPVIVLEDGEMIAGYVPADTLIQRIELKN